MKTNLGEVRSELSQSSIPALRAAIDQTLTAIADGREQVEAIARTTLDEVARLDQEHEELKQYCNAAIEQVEELERESRKARERLMVVNRDIHVNREPDMKKAYETAQRLQIDLGQWREREVQLRMRRDDVARRLKSLRATANRAETLMLQFNHVTSYLQTQFEDVTSVLRVAQEHSLLGLKMLQSQEEEKRSFAQQLHDGPMQSLASVAMMMQVPATAAESAETVVDVRRRLNNIIGDLRQLVFDLRPPLLDDLGLVPTLKRYVNQWSEANKLAVRINLVGLETTLTPTEKVTVFRGVQEALANVAKHAQARQVTMNLVYGGETLRVHVLDDGIGVAEIDWPSWLADGKLGLALSKQRFGMLGGSLDISTIEPNGTELTMELPLIRGT
ncbi:MAG: hypothetical protein A2201_09940 [Alicyclobacillus sp. RIFOXYA1_FULL_53_8]|nr:MAG: hypothetical protein A2201_09940 [Alicyclobacillus sp. RIFOXYA1_FULL_53_8]